MGRLVAIAIVLSVLAGAGVIAGGGVELKHEEEKEPVAAKAAPAAKPATAQVVDASVRQPSGPTAVRVKMKRLALHPATVDVEPGDIVEWDNVDDVAHTVVATGRGGNGNALFESPRFGPGADFRAAAPTAPGTYSYVCSLHPTTMRGTIVVA